MNSMSMFFNRPPPSQPLCSPLSTSSQGSNSSSDDELGLKNVVNGFYAPHLSDELERLFAPPPVETTRSRSVRSVWEEFENNGRETELDELDRLFRGLDTGDVQRQFLLQQQQQHQQQAAMTDAALLLSSTGPLAVHPPIHQPLQSSDYLNRQHNSVEDILTKAKLIEILRERERLQRSKPRRVQKKAGAGGGGSSTSGSGKVCVFCRNNGEAEAVYSSHQLKDPEGSVTCPILYIYTCPICGANGKNAHTIKYCPYNTGDTVCIKDLTKSGRNSIGHHM